MLNMLVAKLSVDSLNSSMLWVVPRLFAMQLKFSEWICESLCSFKVVLFGC